MTEEDSLPRLRELSLEQLSDLLVKVEAKAAAKKEEKERRAHAIKVPPRTSNDIKKMAEEMGLDLSGLMREISRR